jgi:hypothetical protein
MSTVDRTDRRYLDRLAVRLRLAGVSGRRTGDVVAEARAHAAATGEALAEAFGEPRHHARQWERGSHGRRWLRALPHGLGAALGAGVLASGAVALGRSEPALLGLPALWTVLASVAVVLAAAVLLPYDPVRDPRTGAADAPDRGRLLLGLAVVLVLVGALIVLGSTAATGLG